MRPSRTVAGAALTAVLALGSLPGFAGSREPSTARPIDAAAFRQAIPATTHDRLGSGFHPDAAGRSAGVLGPDAALTDVLAVDAASASLRALPNLPGAIAASAWNKPRYILRGTATFYDNGTTAMRLPRGTVVVICGAAGCVERTITDYGPMQKGGRLVDLDRADFFAICGCGWWSGTTEVTVRVY
jgi:hypothetical protein